MQSLYGGEGEGGEGEGGGGERGRGGEGEERKTYRRMVGIFISDLYSPNKTTKTVSYNFIYNFNFQVSIHYKFQFP